MMIIVGIYKITSPSGKVYIGQSWDIKKRWYNHKKSPSNSIIKRSIQKYGFENHVFEIIHELPYDVEQEILDTYEETYIKLYKDAGIKTLNITLGGRGMKGFKLSDIAKKKLSEKAKGRIVSEEVRKKIGQSQLGRKHSQESKNKIGKSNSNNKRPDLAEYNRNFKKGVTGRKASEETKQKISIAHKGNRWALGRIQSQEERSQRSAVVKEWWRKHKQQLSIV